MNWRQLDPATLEREVMPSSVLGGNYLPYLDAYRSQSEWARGQLACQRDRRYGEGARALLDYFPAKSALAPLLVFIHGGYWQALSKDDSALLAPAWHEAGFAHAVVGYDLAPESSLNGIVRQCHAALAHLRRHSEALGFDPARIVVAGSSAGAHLAAMLCLEDEARAEGAAWPPLHAALLLSGAFDLEALVNTTVNEALRLDAAQARALSPLQMLEAGDSSGAPPFSLPEHFPRCLLAVGENETAWFKDQTLRFAAAVARRGVMTSHLEVAGRNHFDLLNAMGGTEHFFFRHCLQFLLA